MPLVSVVVPIFNCERFLEATLHSLQAQTFANWEGLLVIDPKSVDLSESIAKRFALADSRFKIIAAERGGPSAVRNTGLLVARGEYLAFLDSDDLWLEEKLRFQIASMLATESAVSCSAFRRLSQDGQRTGRLISPPRRVSYKRLLQQNCILMSSACVKTSLTRGLAFSEIGCEDFEFWLKILSGRPPALGIQRDLVRYRIVAQSRGSSKLRSLRESWAILRQRPDTTIAQDVLHIGLLSARGALKHSRF